MGVKGAQTTAAERAKPNTHFLLKSPDDIASPQADVMSDVAMQLSVTGIRISKHNATIFLVIFYSLPVLAGYSRPD